MGITEAKAKADISPEERAAVDDYINVNHAAMNALIGFKVVDYFDASSDWILPGLDKNSTPEKAGDEVLALFDKIGLVYSAMAKSTFEHRPPPNRLQRGVSNNEAKKLRSGGTYDKCISTSTSPEVARRFSSGNREPALLRINASSAIPYLNVSEFMGKENLNRYEQEYILSPFAKVSQARFSSDWQGCKYYDVSLEAPSIKPFEEGEKEKLAAEIKAEFASILEIGKEYSKAYRNLHFCEEERHKGRGNSFIDNLYQESGETYSRLSPMVKAFEEKMSRFSQGLFMERQQEVFKAYDELRTAKNMEYRAQQEAAKKATIEKKSLEMMNSANGLNQNATQLPSNYVSEYNKMLEQEQMYSNIARALGIPFTMQVPRGNIENGLQTMKTNIDTLQTRVTEVVTKKYESEIEIQQASSEVQGYSENVADIRSADGLSQAYASEAAFESKKGIDEKIQRMILSTKLQILEAKKKEVENRKISFFGKLRGLGKVKEAELRNLALEENIIRGSQIIPKSNYSIQDSLAELRAFTARELGGTPTQEMLQFDSAIKQFFGVDDRVINQKANEKLNQQLPAVQPQGKMRTSKRLEQLNQRGQALQAELSNMPRMAYTPFTPGAKPGNSRETFLKRIKEAIQLTQVSQNRDRSVMLENQQPYLDSQDDGR